MDVTTPSACITNWILYTLTISPPYSNNSVSRRAKALPGGLRGAAHHQQLGAAAPSARLSQLKGRAEQSRELAESTQASSYLRPARKSSKKRSADYPVYERM